MCIIGCMDGEGDVYGANGQTMVKMIGGAVSCALSKDGWEGGRMKEGREGGGEGMLIIDYFSFGDGRVDRWGNQAKGEEGWVVGWKRI